VWQFTRRFHAASSRVPRVLPLPQLDEGAA
jgi:hypothetical protein